MHSLESHDSTEGLGDKEVLVFIVSVLTLLVIGWTVK